MSYLIDFLKGLFANDCTLQEQEINRLRDDIKHEKRKTLYCVVGMVVMFFITIAATLTAVEFGIH